MKKFSWLLIAFSILLLLTSLQQATAQSVSQEESASGAIVCEPGLYTDQTPTDCLPLGPSQYLAQLAEIGLTLPLRPLPAHKPDLNLTELPYRYFKLDDDFVPTYKTPDDTSPTGQSFAPGFVYISYNERLDTGHGIYYLLPSGGWIPGKGARVGEISNFQGLVFTKTPRNSFGWTFEEIPVKLGPGYNAPNTNIILKPFTVIQIFDTQRAENADWNMIGPNQWVEARKVAQVNINKIHPEGVPLNRWIDINLAEQSLAVYDNNELVFATVIASGLEPFWTRPGLFQIYQKKETETMRTSDPTDFYYLDNVPWTMYFDGARALHGAYWRTRFGYPQSHGCVNLSVGDSHWLYNWASEGDWVYIHDPSGQTPTDPALYHDYAY